MPAKSFNFWPLSITGFIGVVVILIVWTVYFALQNPVQREDSFLASYQEADAVINNIQESQSDFTAHYALKWEGALDTPITATNSRAQKIEAQFDSLDFPQGFAFSIIPKDSSATPQITEIRAILTRPHTKLEDQNLSFTLEDSKTTQPNASYRSNPLSLPSAGRWIVQGVITYTQPSSQDSIANATTPKPSLQAEQNEAEQLQEHAQQTTKIEQGNPNDSDSKTAYFRFEFFAKEP